MQRCSTLVVPQSAPELAIATPTGRSGAGIDHLVSLKAPFLFLMSCNLTSLRDDLSGIVGGISISTYEATICFRLQVLEVTVFAQRG